MVSTVLLYGGVSELWYRVYGKDWQKGIWDIDLQRESIYLNGKEYKGYQSVFYIIWDTNTLLPGEYTLEIRLNNTFQSEYFTFNYSVKRNVALEGIAWGSSDASNLIDDEDYIDSYSGFASNDLGSALYIELPCTYSIQAFEFRLWDGDGRYYQYKIEISEENSTWIEVVNRSSGEWRSWQWIGFEKGNLTAKYIKITGIYNSANQWYHITEFRIFSYNDTILHGKVVVNGEALRSSTLRITDENNSLWMEVSTDEYGFYQADLFPLNFSEGDMVNLSIIETGYVGWNTTEVGRYVSQIYMEIICMNVRFFTGWNLISIAWQNISTDFQDLLSGIPWERAMVYIEGRWYTFERGRSEIYNIGFPYINNSVGIWVYTSGNATLVGPGKSLGISEIQLRKGWNLVGYPSAKRRNLSLALSGIPYDYVETYNISSGAMVAMKDSDTMEASKAYWIYVREDSIWTVEW